MTIQSTDAERRVREVMAQVLEQDVAAIGEDTRQETVPAWDSLRHLELMMTLEHELGVSFSMEEVVSLTSYRAIADALSHALAG